MIWTILGIEETKDKKLITRAYREKLSDINPEEKPEEFKELRSAYEQALQLADKEEKPQEEKTELELWVDDLSALYFDLRKRIDVDAWKDLLSEKICIGIDTRADAEDALIRFLMDNFHISHNVMLYLNDQFSFTDRVDELKEKYPADFIEYIILNNIRYNDNFPQEMFTPGIDGHAADEYEKTYHKAARTAPDDAADLYDKMRNSSEKHPYGEALMLKVRLGKNDPSAIDEIKKLHEQWPLDDHLAADLMFSYKELQQFDEAEKIADEILDRNPAYMSAKRMKADAAAAREDYHAAVDILNHLMNEFTGEQGRLVELNDQRRKWNELMMQQLREKLKEDPSDVNSLYDLIWCLIQNNRAEEADELAKDLPEEQPDPFGYYNAKAVLAGEGKRFEEALDYTKKLLAAVEALQPDGTKKTEERMARRIEVMGRISSLLYNLGRKDEAIEYAEKSIENDDVDLGSIFNLATLHLGVDHFERADELTDMILKRDPENSGAFYLKAFANFKMGRDNIAFESVNSAIERDGSDLQFYLLKLRIFVRNGAYEPANELIDFLESNGIKNDATVDYCKLFMFADQESNEHARTQEEYDEILELAKKVDEKFADGDLDKPDWAAHFYYLYACVTADRQDFDKKYPIEPIVGILDKGLKKDPDYYSCLSYKAWLLKKDKQYDEALKIYKKLEQLPNHNFAVEENLAEIYYSDLDENAEEALRYYKMRIEREPENSNNYFFAGMCELRLEHPEESADYFRLEQKYGPDDIDGYYRIAYALLKSNKLEEAVENGKKSVELAKERTEKDTVRFWSPLILAYRRLGKFDEALAALEDCAKHNPDYDPKKKKFAILLQAGRIEEAYDHVKQWRSEARKDFAGWTTAKTELLMIERKINKLQSHIINYVSYIEASKLKDAKMLIAAKDASFKRYLDIANKYYEQNLKDGKLTTYLKGNHAWELFLCGETKKAEDLAAEVLMDLDDEIKKATGMKLLAVSRKFRLLSVMGMFDEAEKVLEEAKKLPLCETCEYCACKDIDYYMCEMQIARGNFEKALELAIEGQKKWPDDPDFIEMEYAASAKMKGK